MECCPGGPPEEVQGTAEEESTAAETLRQFKSFMAAAGAPGALDATAKRAAAIALSLLAKCAPCAKTHIKKARAMGFTQPMIDEAANLAIEFGGCPVMALYNEVKGAA